MYCECTLGFSRLSDSIGILCSLAKSCVLVNDACKVRCNRHSIFLSIWPEGCLFCWCLCMMRLHSHFCINIQATFSRPRWRLLFVQFLLDRSKLYSGTVGMSVTLGTTSVFKQAPRLGWRIHGATWSYIAANDVHYRQYVNAAGSALEPSIHQACCFRKSGQNSFTRITLEFVKLSF